MAEPTVLYVMMTDGSLVVEGKRFNTKPDTNGTCAECGLEKYTWCEDVCIDQSMIYKEETK